MQCVSFFLHSLLLSLTQPSHPVCPLCLRACIRQRLHVREKGEHSVHLLHIFISTVVLQTMSDCMSVNNSAHTLLSLLSLLHFYGCAFRPAALLEDLRLCEGIPGTALSTCASAGISSAMSVMCRPRWGYSLLPIFGKSFNIASPQPDLEIQSSRKHEQNSGADMR